jgi:hypothetical protein
MHSNQQKSAVPSNDQSVAQKQPMTQHEAPDERFPGTFFRVPGVPMPGKTTWSLVK